MRVSSLTFSTCRVQKFLFFVFLKTNTCLIVGNILSRVSNGTIKMLPAVWAT